MASSLTIWKEPANEIVPKEAKTADLIVQHASQLSRRDQHQITEAFKSESFEMVSTFVLKKALSALKRQLATLGMEFLGEMLGRPDIDADSNPLTSVSDQEALELARVMGIMSSLDAKRISHSLELLAYLDDVPLDESDSAEMSEHEALIALRTCIQSVLGREISAPVEFVKFRQALESNTFKSGDPDVDTLISSPYFFRKITLSILLSGLKARSGAQFEHLTGNAVVLIPILWSSLRGTEKWSIGQAYSEAVSSGNRDAAVALKKALTQVKGFDFVPESLRSSTYTAAAGAVLEAHSGVNNFYNEPEAVRLLSNLGSTIPWPAFPVCMSALLAIRLGNQYGQSWAAQGSIEAMLKRLTSNQWEYYLNECLPGDSTVLQKLAWYEKPRGQWFDLTEEFLFGDKHIKDRVVKSLIRHSVERSPKLKDTALKLLSGSSS